MHDVIADTLRSLAVRGPVLVGGSAALAHAGWTTQFNMLPDILCNHNHRPEGLGIRLRSRKPEILEILEKWTADIPYGTCPVLRPEMAIADALVDRMRGGRTHIYDPDDIDPDETEEMSFRLFCDALDALEASAEETQKALSSYGPVLDGRVCGMYSPR